MRRWRRLKCCVDTARALSLLLLRLGMKLAEEGRKRALCLGIILSLIIIWIIYSHLDPCQGRRITSKLCQDYANGEVSGHLCPLLCREKTIYLSQCTENGPEKSFRWGGMVMRVPGDLRQQDVELSLVEGMLPSEFTALLIDYVQLQLGPSDFTRFSQQLKSFADFNEDGKLSLGEAQSLWRLVHNQEFLILFIFQSSYSFPTLNGTCGSLFGFQYPEVSHLYNRHAFPFSLVSSHAYRWFLPSWELRAKVSVGLLDLMFDIYEENHIRYFMCDVNPASVGYSGTHEALLPDGRRVLSGAMLAQALQNRTCSYDHHCHYSPYCTTMCDRAQRVCTGEVTKPTLWQTCHLLQEYLLFDAPSNLRPTLGRLLDRCSHLIIYGQSIDLSHVVLITDLKTILWDHIKNLDI